MTYEQIKTPSNVRMFYESAHPDGYFFSRETMRFFKDTMKSYGIRRIDGIVYLYRKTPLARSGRFAVWKLDPVTYDLHGVSDEIKQRIYS